MSQSEGAESEEHLLRIAVIRIAFLSVALTIPLLGGCGPSPRAERAPAVTFHTPYGRPKYPFSPAVQTGNLVFLAGQIGTDSTGKLVPGGIKAEARQAMENIGDVLRRVGSSWDRVVKCTIMMADIAEWPAMNAVYATYFPRQFPARSAFGATGLALGARVEIECVAVAAG